MVLLNAKAQELSRRGIERGLSEYVRGGGGLMIGLGDNVEVEAYNRVLAELLPQPLAVVKTAGSLPSHPASEGESSTQGPGEHLGQLDRRHPLLQPFLTGRASESLLSATFARYLLLQPTPRSQGETTVLLSFESGAPALVERTVGRGRVLLFTSTLDRDWNDLPIQPAFLPLVQQVVRHLSRAPLQKAETETLIGQTRDIKLQAGDTRVEVTLPSGKTRLFERLSVNLDAAESDLQLAPASRLAALQRPLLQNDASPSGKNPKRKVELWHALGWLLLVLLLGESLLLRQK